MEIGMDSCDGGVTRGLGGEVVHLATVHTRLEDAEEQPQVGTHKPRPSDNLHRVQISQGTIVGTAHLNYSD